MCLTKDLVYNGRCNICAKEYAGEAKQFFGCRVDQHHNQNGSAICQHFEEDRPDESTSVSWSIISKTAGFVQRKITEAIALKKNHFELNRKVEGCGVVNLF